MSDNKQLKRKIRKFLDTHPDKEISAAKLEYSLFLYGDWPEKVASQYVAGIKGVSEAERLQRAEIKSLSDPADIEKWMRKKLSSSSNKLALRNKMLEYEDEMEERIKHRSLRSRQDEFIENALYFFLHSQKNHSEWIMGNLDNFNSPYLRSMFCLVVGFRGERVDVERMMEETEYFERNYPEESFEQGPLLAVYELNARFFIDSQNKS